LASRGLWFRLTGWGWAFLFLCLGLAVGAFNANLNIIYLLASLVIAIFLVSLVVPVWNLLGVECRRSPVPSPFAGEPFEVRVWLHNGRRRPARAVTVEEPLGASRPSPARALAMIVPARSKVCLSYRASAQGRGIRPMPPLRWFTGYPFGLVEFGMRGGSEGRLVVYPARGRLSAAAVASLKPRAGGMGARAVSGYPGDEVRLVRDYRPGDNPKQIHWRLSAHLGKLCVREMEPERLAATLVILDSRVPSSTRLSGRRRALEALELAVSFAAEVCRVSLREGSPVTLVGYFPTPQAIACRRPEEMPLLYEALAGLDPSPEESADALLDCAGRARLSAAWQVLAVTPTRRTAEGLTHSLGRIRARVYVAEDPEFATVFRLVGESPHARRRAMA